MIINISINLYFMEVRTIEQKFIVFLAVVAEKNFSRAASKLFISQPAISQYIQALEAELGTILFERGRKGVVLTKAGEIVLKHVKELKSVYESMAKEVEENIHEPKGMLKIGASYTFGEYVLPYVIAMLLKQYPLIQPSIVIGNTKEIGEGVANRKLDIGLIEGETHHSSLDIQHVAKDTMYIVAHKKHPLLLKDSVKKEDLQDVTWLIRERGSGTREAIERFFLLYEIKPSKTLEFGSTQIIKESVEAGIGISLLSAWAVRKELHHGVFQYLKMEGMPLRRNFSMIKARSQFETKACEVFRDTVNTFFRDDHDI